MEQVFKTKRARRWWIIIVSLVVLIIFLNVYLEQSWAFSALGGIIISALMFYSQSKTIYIVKDNGVLEIKPGWGNRICVDGIRKVSYNPNAIGMQKVKIEHAQAREQIVPNIFRSCLLDGCIESGLCEEAGGPKYSQSLCITSTGIDAVNSLYAIKHLIYDTKQLTWEQLKKALAANFEGYEDIQKLCFGAPKHGNDIEDVDQLTRRFFRDVERIYRSHGPDYFGYEAHMDPFSLSYHNYFAPMTGALPNGRQKGVALTDASVSAMPGTDVNGSTALIKSAAQAIDTVRNNCNHMNMKFLPSALEGPSGTRMLLNLIKTYFDLGGGHIQFNCVSSETLCDAQEHPQNYKNLVVRVAGFSSYFTRLYKGVQDEIIKRTEYQNV